MGRGRMRRRVAPRLLLLAVAAVLVSACSGIPSSGPVHDVSKAADEANQQAPATPDPGMTPDAIVRGFIYAAARISLAGTAAPYAASKQYLTGQAAQTWQRNPSPVIIVPDQFRIEPTGDPAALMIRAPILGELDTNKAYRPGAGSTYRVTVHLTKEDGQWRINDPPAELLIRQSDFNSVFSVRTLYFLDQAHSVVVPDRRYLINGGTPDSRIIALLNLLLHGPAGVLQGAADSELTGAALRTQPTTDTAGLTQVDLKGIDLPTSAERNALAAQVVWTLSPDASQVAIDINGSPLDPSQPVYTSSTVDSFSPDRVPGTGAVASDPYFIDGAGGIVDLLTRKTLYRGDALSSPVLSAAMSAATGTMAAVTDTQNPDGSRGQQLLIGQPQSYEQAIPALKATTLTQPSFSRSGDEVWVVQNGDSKTPEIYQVSTSRTSSGTAPGTGSASRAKVGSAQLAGKGTVTSMVVSPDGVRVAVVAGGRLYLGAIAAVGPVKPGAATTATDAPDALALVNLLELRTDLTSVGPVAFSSANDLFVVSSNLPGYRSLKQVKVDGSELSQASTDSQYGDITSTAVSAVDPTAQAPSDPSTVGTTALYVTIGQPGAVGPVLKLQGSFIDGRWVPFDATAPMATSVFFPN